MIWLLIAILAFMAVSLCYISMQLGILIRLLTRASDLNLEASGRLLNRLEIISDHTLHTAFGDDD